MPSKIQATGPDSDPGPRSPLSPSPVPVMAVPSSTVSSSTVKVGHEHVTVHTRRPGPAAPLPSNPAMGSPEGSTTHLAALPPSAALPSFGAALGGHGGHQRQSSQLLPPEPLSQSQQIHEPVDASAFDEATAHAASTAIAPRVHRVALVSDFFYPGFGGVEIHIYNVAQCLMRRGHHVVVITRAYGDRIGVRYVTGGLKVYYVPFIGVPLPPGTSTLPTIVGLFPLLRNIFLRERLTIVHGHQTTSNLCHEALFHAGTMGIKVCFTDHSLFGFADAASIHINKVLQWSLRCVDQVICVSNTSRENTVLRARTPPQRVSVVPNATDTASFTPPDHMRYKVWGAVTRDIITIVVITRLVYRKGSDLFVDVIPELCRRHANVRWIVGGDGPRMPQLQRMVEKHNLYDRVTLLGQLKHADVKQVLNQGQIFLNCSLTEAFCIALIEAASAGLLCVSTGVGGVPEVLPPDMLYLAKPSPDSILEAMEKALRDVHTVNPWEFHDSVRKMYSWDWVAERTERVYDRIMVLPTRTLVERLLMYMSIGRVYGILAFWCCAWGWITWQLLRMFMPAADVEVAVDFPCKLYGQKKDKLLQTS